MAAALGWRKKHSIASRGASITVRIVREIAKPSPKPAKAPRKK